MKKHLSPNPLNKMASLIKRLVSQHVQSFAYGQYSECTICPRGGGAVSNLLGVYEMEAGI